MIKVGVLGASGFIGSRLVEMLHLEQAAEVIPIVRSTNSLARLARFQLKWRIADALDYAQLADAFRGCDIVVHSVFGPTELIINAPEVAYRAAQAANVRRIIYLSTAVVHGMNPEIGTDEDSPLHTRHPVAYSNAKVLAEWKFAELRKRGSVELAMLRPGIVFGPRDNWVSRVAVSILDGTAYTVAGVGICNTTYVDNLVHAIRLAMTAAVDGETFIIVDREQITWRAIYESVSRSLRSTWEIPEYVNPDVLYEHADLISALKEFCLIRKLVPSIPKSWKLGVRKAIDTVISTRDAVREVRMRTPRNPFQLPSNGNPKVPVEVQLLQRCAYKFSGTRAHMRLGFEPPISVEEGMQRTFAWLKSVGFPIVTPC